MINILKQNAKKLYNKVTHTISKITHRYYFEDFNRVYPEQQIFNRFGAKRQAQKNDLNNYLNHKKFYQFVAQFVKGKTVVDVGCGSGYGCEILSKAGAVNVTGCDLSTHAIRYAQQNFGQYARFEKLGITDLLLFSDSTFDVTIANEVIEHIKEYHQEEKAIKELG